MSIEISSSTTEELARQFKSKLKARGFTYDELLNYACYISALHEIDKEAISQLVSIQKDINCRDDEIKAAFDQLQEMSLRHSSESFDEGSHAGWKARAKYVSKKATDARYNQPKGDRERGHKVREMWAGGQFLSHEKCAEAAAQSLSMAYETARRHLYNAPPPNPWPARDAIFGKLE